MDEQAYYWGVDEQGTPYPLTSIEEWRDFHDQYPERVRIAWEEWLTDSPSGDSVEASTKFFGTDASEGMHKQRCMFETAVFLDGRVIVERRVETRNQARLAHTEEVLRARKLYPPREKGKR